MYIEESAVGIVVIILAVFILSYLGDTLFQYILDRKDNFNRGDSC